MERFFDILRKTLVGTIAIVFAFVVVYVPQVPKSQALIAQPVIESNPGSLSAWFTTASATLLESQKETVLDQIGFLLAKTMISQMLQSMVTWINSGFKGSPAFIQDLDRFLLNVADETAGKYIQSLGDIGSFICSPFRLDIQLALSLRYQRAREGKDRDNNSCTLSGVANNIENFFNGQVSRENFWEQWVRVTSQPEDYTPYGQFMAAEAQLNARIVNARGQELQIANWGNGFLSNEVCELIEGPTTSSQNEPVNLLPPEYNVPEVASTTGGAAAAAPAQVRQRCVISTPGKVISEQLNKALGAGQDQLVAADEINEVISALLGQIANQALTGAAGLLGLSVGTGYTAGGYGSGSYVDELARESRNNSDSFLAQNYDQVKEKLQVQRDYNVLSIQYIPRLQEIISAPTTTLRFRGLSTNQISDLKSRAQVSYNDAIEVRDNTTEHIAFLAPLVTRYENLQRELAASSTPQARRQIIATEQAQIISRAASYSAYTLYRLRTSQREWSSITGS